MARYQIEAILKIDDNRIKSVNQICQNFPNLSFLNDFYLKYRDNFHLKVRQKMEGPSKPLPSQEQEQKQEQKQEQDYLETLSRSRDDKKIRNHVDEKIRDACSSEN